MNAYCLFFCCSQRTIQETKGWDVFRDPPVKQEGGSMESQKCLEITVKICKILAYILTFIIVLAGGVISKGTLLFMTSQLEKGRKISYCNHELGNYTKLKIHVCILLFEITHHFLNILGRDKQFLAELPDSERVAWMWCIYFAFLVPEIGAFIRSLRICFFKSWKKPSYGQFIMVKAFSSIHAYKRIIVILIKFKIIGILDRNTTHNWFGHSFLRDSTKFRRSESGYVNELHVPHTRTIWDAV